MKKNLKWIICSISFIIFIILSIFVMSGKDLYLDSIIYKYIARYISEDLTTLISCLTCIGGATVVIIVTIITILKNKKFGFFLALNLVIITLLQLILKAIFARERPVDISLIDEYGYSFPSGHSLTSMAIYGFIIYMIYISKLSKKSKIFLITIFSILIFIVGFSRIYLGVHFFTDVIGGFTFSISYLIIYINLIKEKLK